MHYLPNIIKRLAQITLAICILLFATTYVIEAIVEEENNHYAQSVCENAIGNIERIRDKHSAKELRVINKTFGKQITCELQGRRIIDNTLVKYTVIRTNKNYIIKRYS